MKHFEKIEQYLAGNLSTEETQEFEGQIASDPELAQEVESQRFEERVISLALEDAIREQVSAFRMEEGSVGSELYPGGKIKSMNRFFLPLSLAASLLLVIGYFFARNQYTNSSLQKKFYNLDISNSTRGNESGNSGVLEEGQDALYNGDLDRALILFTEAERVDSFKVEADYYLGHLYYQKGNFDESLVRFEKVLAQGRSAGLLEDDAKWYSIIAKLGIGDLDHSFDKRLDELVKINYPQSKKLKEQLNSIWR